MDLNPRLDHEGFGRELAPSDIKKVSRGEITASFFVDTATIRAQKAAFANGDMVKHTKEPGERGWDLLEGEMAVGMRGSTNNAVFTALNGLEAAAAKMFPDNPVLCRDIMMTQITPRGVIREDARTDMAGAKVTLRVGGTCPGGAPSEYTVPGTEDAFLTDSCGVVFDAPDLKNPIQFGNEESGRPKNKITLQPRAANKTMIATRALNIISHLIHDPVRMKEAMEQNEHVANSWIKLGFSVLNSYQVAHCMALNQDLRREIGATGGAAFVGAPFQVNPLFPELLIGTTTEPGREPKPVEQIIANYAELIGLLPAGRVAVTLSATRKQYWAEHAFALKNALLPTPHIDSKSYNVAYAFGFSRMGPNNTIESLATNGDVIKRTPIGQLYAKSLVHTQEMIQALVVCANEEKRLTMGVVTQPPNPTGTNIFEYQIIPNGGVGDIGV